MRAWLPWIAVAGCGFEGPPVVGQVLAADAGFDVARCPASYNADLPGPSRYRLIADGHPAWSQSDACAADLDGATHLVVLSSMAELDAIAALVGAPPIGIAGNAVWIGAVQPLTATRPDEGWLGFDGNPMLAVWGGIEPNEHGDNNEADHEEQFVKIERPHAYLSDAVGTDSLGALCECDGVAIAENAAALIAALRPGS
jgi:hypothetical protein